MEFSSLNGYDVKDKIARNLIESINQQVEFIFPKFVPNTYSGDSNLIKYDNKSILIDTYSTDYYQHLKAMLIDNNIEHIDYLIITHYHADHTGGIKSLIEDGYIDTDTVIYMPAEVTAYNQYHHVNEQIAYFQQLFNQYGLSYTVPQENEVLTINKLKLTFYNCDAEYLDSQYNVGTHYDYNECSTQVLIEYRNTKALYTGDAWVETLKRMRTENFVKGQVDLYKIEHHGINPTTDDKFIESIAPKYAVQTGAVLDEVKNNFGVCNTIKILHDIGTKIYATQRNENYIKFISDGSSVSCSNGKEYVTGVDIADINLYVDINADKTIIQDGTQEKPFSELMQAVVYALNYPSSLVNINLADGLYCKSHESSNTHKNYLILKNCKDKLIRIYGNNEDRTAVKINCAYLIGANVEFNNLTIYNDYASRPAINSINSDFILNNVLITSSNGEVSNNKGVVIRNNSKARLNNVKVEKSSTGIEILSSDVVINEIEYNLNTNNITTSIDSKIFYKGYESPHVLFSSTDSTEGKGTVPISESAINLGWIEIQFTDSGKYFHNTTGRIYNPNNSNVPVVLSYKNNQGKLIMLEAVFQITGSNIIVKEELTTTLSNGENPTVASSTGSIRIERVTAGKKINILE